MLALRYAALLALVVWAGGLLALGLVAAPATFEVLAARQAPEGRGPPGGIFGEKLRRFYPLGYLCGAVMILTLAPRRILGPRPRRAGVRLALASIMLAATMYSGLVVAT